MITPILAWVDPFAPPIEPWEGAVYWGGPVSMVFDEGAPPAPSGLRMRLLMGVGLSLFWLLMERGQ